jgi:tetratricopeptide (TPR) repeat protein
MFRNLLIHLGIFVFIVEISVCDEGTDYQRGLQLIQSGQLDESVLFFQKAIRIEPDNLELQKEFNNLRQIIKIRRELPTEKNAVQWSIRAERLRRFYIEYRVVSEHLKLVLEVHRRAETLAHAIDVIDAFLMAEQYQAALDFLLSQKQPDQILPLQVEKARIYYKAGEKDHARKIVRSIPSDQLNSSETLFRLARVQSLTLQHASAVKTLKRCFELTPSLILPSIKKDAEKCPEFVSILNSAEFLEVMGTHSLIPSDEMKCSQKWIEASSTSDEHQRSPQNIIIGEINFNDWRIY